MMMRCAECDGVPDFRVNVNPGDEPVLAVARLKGVPSLAAAAADMKKRKANAS